MSVAVTEEKRAVLAPPFNKPLLKSAEVAQLFGVTISTISFWVKHGRLRPRRTPGGNFRFAREQVMRLWEEKRRTRTAERRAEARVRCYFQIKVRFGDTEQMLDAVLLDISDHGMGVAVAGASVELKSLRAAIDRPLTLLRCSGTESVPFAHGTVVRVAQQETPGRIVVGVRLDTPTTSL